MNEEKNKGFTKIEDMQVTGMIAGLIKYLKNTEIKGSKYSIDKNQTTKNL